MTSIEGSIERVTYYNKENGYTVLRLRPKSGRNKKIPGLNLDGLLTVVGNLPELSPGESIRLEGDYTTHAKHGLQFKALKCEKLTPVTSTAIERYLGSGLIKGIGPKLAKRIVDVFQEQTLEIIEKEPQRLSDVPGIGEDRTAKIKAAWDEQQRVKEIMLFLHGHGVSTNLAVKIYKTYGEQSLDVLKENPYQLEEDIYGVGFKTADKLAQDLGLPQDHPSRIEAGIVYAINESLNEGHVYLPVNLLTRRASELLEVSSDLISPGLERLSNGDRIRSINDFNAGTDRAGSGSVIAEKPVEYGESIVYLTPFYHSEKGVAEKISELNAYSAGPRQGQLIIDGEHLSYEQKNALQTSLVTPVSVITGGPGTGKTTCLKALIQCIERQNIRYALASPTGRAAKRLSEATNRPASTIHRLLAYSPGTGYKYHKKHPLKIDFLVIDEASMLDILLAHHLLQALRPGTQLVFVGDVDQLPPVGAGNLLRDIIDSNAVPVSRLTKIYRQAEDSKIITNAHRINKGNLPSFSKTTAGDFFLFPAENDEEAADWIVDLLAARIPNQFGMDPVEDIQVLSPMYRGKAGVNSLNVLLQNALNPEDKQKLDVKLFGQTFRIGDKVMQVRNNYDKDVFNGDIGRVSQINKIDQSLSILFDGVRKVNYDFSELDEVVLAYAVSVHKSQGSEFPAVVMPVITQHYIMLQRNLIYTAITRAEQLCILVGNYKALNIAVRNNKITQRNSKLAERLKMPYL
jgi:exodeoxyribonuclease V alpha subunit